MIRELRLCVAEWLMSLTLWIMPESDERVLFAALLNAYAKNHPYTQGPRP